jgi:hypothetical protein
VRDPQDIGRASGYRAACRDITRGYQRLSPEALAERARKVRDRYYADLDPAKFIAGWQSGYSM